MYAKLLGFGAAYGLGYTIVKSLFPSPVLLLLFSNEQTGEGNLTMLALVYMLSGLLAGIIGGPLFGAFLLRRRKASSSAALGWGAPRPSPVYSGPDLGKSLALSLAFALSIGFISALLTMGAYQFGVLPQGGVLDPLALIKSSNFSPGYPLLIAWTFARDLLPAMLAGLMLAPFGGNFLYRLYAANRPSPVPRSHSFEEDF